MYIPEFDAQAPVFFFEKYLPKANQDDYTEFFQAQEIAPADPLDLILNP